MSLSQIPWQVLIILSGLLTTVSISINKHQARRVSALQVLGYKYLINWLVIGTLWWIFNSQVPGNWWMFYLYGMVVAMAVAVYTKALRISMSQTVLTDPIGQLMGIVLALIVLSEWQLFAAGIGGIKLLTALLLMPLTFWLFYEPKSAHSKQWIKLILIFVMCMAVFKVVVKIFVNSAPAVTVLFFQYFGSMTISWVGILTKKRAVWIDKQFAITGFIQGIAGSLAILFLYTALKLATVTQTTLLRTPLIVILGTLSGLLGFKEIKNMTRKKWLGTGVAGIIMILVLAANR